MALDSIEDIYPDISLREAICKQVAIYKLSGLSVKTTADKLGISTRKIHLFWDSIEVAHYIRTISDGAVKDFKSTLVREVAKLVPLMVDTLRQHLEEKNLNAIPHALKIMGFDKEEVEQHSNITVILPGQGAESNQTATFEYKPENTDILSDVKKKAFSENEIIDVVLPTDSGPIDTSS
jgi:hypothetical protein